MEFRNCLYTGNGMDGFSNRFDADVQIESSGLNKVFLNLIGLLVRIFSVKEQANSA